MKVHGDINAFAGCAGMTELSVGGCTGIEGNLTSLLQKLAQLRVLNCFDCEVTGSYRDLELIPSLHKIVLTGQGRAAFIHRLHVMAK